MLLRSCSSMYSVLHFVGSCLAINFVVSIVTWYKNSMLLRSYCTLLIVAWQPKLNFEDPYISRSKGGRGDHEVARVGRPATTNKIVASP